jgi:penicillin-binding protein 2
VLKRIAAPIRYHIPLSSDQLNYIRNAMYGVTTEPGGTATGAFAGFPMSKVKVGGKTGTAEVDVTHNFATAWFASFAGLASEGKPRFVTVIMVDRGGQGGVVAAPAVRQVWDTVFGVEGKKAAFPTGEPPRRLPHVGPVGAPAPKPSMPPSAPATTTTALPAIRLAQRKRLATSM